MRLFICANNLLDRNSNCTIEKIIKKNLFYYFDELYRHLSRTLSFDLLDDLTDLKPSYSIVLREFKDN